MKLLKKVQSLRLEIEREFGQSVGHQFRIRGELSEMHRRQFHLVDRCLQSERCRAILLVYV